MSMPIVSPTMPYTVSIVEDDEVLRKERALQLGGLGFTVVTFADTTGT